MQFNKRFWGGHGLPQLQTHTTLAIISPPSRPFVQTAQLAELVFQLREEADGLRQQLERSGQQAQASDHSTRASLEQLQAAAAEWRRVGEDSQEQLAGERERRAALEAEAQRLQLQAEQLRRELEGERQQRQAAAGELAALKAATAGSPAGGAALAAKLKQRLQMERGWLQAVTQWLQGEMQTRNDLERVLVNVGTAVRVGGMPAHDGRQGEAPPLPPRRMASSQLMAGRGSAAAGVAHPAAHTPPAAGVTVTVHSPGATTTVGVAGSGCGSRSGAAARVVCGGASRARASWRQHFEETMQAFDERHGRLQQELSSLRREALQAAVN
jgi:hypothetical protein